MGTRWFPAIHWADTPDGGYPFHLPIACVISEEAMATMGIGKTVRVFVVVPDSRIVGPDPVWPRVVQADDLQIYAPAPYPDGDRLLGAADRATSTRHTHERRQRGEE